MNAYDFDKTILKRDSTAMFYFWSLKKYPSILLELPRAIAAAVPFFLGLKEKTAFKQTLFRFFRKIPDIDNAVSLFWDTAISEVADWYMAQKREDDVIISASPEFLLRPACTRLGIKNLIASRVDQHTGRYTGLNCWGEEKVRRFREVYGDVQPDAFYSDSYSDSPMANISKESYIVSGEKLSPWNQSK